MNGNRANGNQVDDSKINGNQVDDSKIDTLPAFWLDRYCLREGAGVRTRRVMAGSRITNLLHTYYICDIGLSTFLFCLATRLLQKFPNIFHAYFDIFIFRYPEDGSEPRSLCSVQLY